jgi:predicted DCC family thiol-disulfide oxidoreductase YuxK
MSSAENQMAWELKLLYDGGCPMCRREAEWLARRSRDGRLVIENIAAPGFDPARYGKSLDDLMQVMHGVHRDGSLITRVAVFREAYRLTGLGWLLAPTAWPGLRWLADRGYELFARHRLRIGRWLGAEECTDGRCAVKGKQREVGK